MEDSIHRKTHKATWLVPALALLVGLALTAGAVRASRLARHKQLEANFQRRADTFESDVTRRMGLAEAVLKGLRAAHTMSARTSDRDVRAYAVARDLPHDAPGVRSIGVVERVPGAELDAFLERERADGHTGFALSAAGGPDEHFVVRSLQPLERNAKLVGLDLASIPEARDAMAVATETGAGALSAPLHLPYDPEGHLSWFLLLPSYKGEPQTPGERREALTGFTVALISPDSVLGPVSELLGTAVQLRVFDGTPQEGRLLFDSLTDGQSADHRLETTRPLLVGNRVLTLQFRSTPRLQDPAGKFIPLFLGLGGVALSMLLALSAWLLLSARRRAQQIAQAMTADLRQMALVVERTTGGAFVTDSSGRVTWANKGFQELVGRSRASLLGRSIAQLAGEMGNLSSDGLHTIDADLLAANSRRGELQGRRLDGSVFWTDVEMQPILSEHGTLTGHVGIAIDITQRKEAEVKAKASEHRIRLITDNIPAQLSYWDSTLRCRFANQKFCEIHSRSRDEIVGQDFFATVAEPVLTAMRPHVHAALNGEIRQFEVQEGGGGLTTWLVNLLPDVKDGRTVGFFSLASDVTEVRRARDLALTASQAKTRFLSSMSHEIRTPMNAIVGMLTLLRGTPLDSRQLDYADKADSAARSLLSLLNDILDLSKIEAGRMELNVRPFSLETLLRDVATILSASVGAKELDVMFDIDPRLPATVVGDDMRLRQILINLGSNAVKFTASGEVVVVVLVVDRQEESVRLRLEVRDTGIGISEEEQNLLFADYSQANSTIARTFGGTGLGLGICRRLASMMGSELRMQSTPGTGSCFWLELDLQVESGEPQPVPALPIRRVLVVDDNDCARELLAAMCRAQGWLVQSAASGQEALGLLRDRGVTFDAIFLDWRMPGLDGWQTIRRIRSMQPAGRTPLLVMVTAYGREMLGRRPAEEQSLLDGYLVKPFTAGMLLAALEPALGEGRLAPQLPQPQVQALSGLRLLVVEDNMVNQQIAFELLARQGAHIELAADGEQAIARLRNGEPYDLVLMDVMMPVMDGLTATRYIRTEMGMSQLPIVAMTANAMDSDRAECIAAGMDDHVGKPFVLADLLKTIRSHVGRQTTEVAPLPALGALEESMDKLLDRSTAISNMGGHVQLFEEMLPMFRRNLEEALETLSNAGRSSSAADIKRLMHTLKGTAGTMGAVRLARVAASAEDRLRRGSMHHSEVEEVSRVVRLTLELVAQPTPPSAISSSAPAG